MAAFPRRAWAAALRRVLREAPDEALRLGDPRGRIELRSELAVYLGRARGVVATPERIVICSGYVQALALLTAVMGPTVAMEDPCLALHREVVGAAGKRVVPVAVDDGGARVETLASDAALVVTPAHQIGLGATLAPERAGRARRVGTRARWSSRTTTTASSATTAARSARSRRSRPTTSSTQAPRARPSPPRSGSPGSSCPNRWSSPSSKPSGWPTRRARRSTSSRSRG